MKKSQMLMLAVVAWLGLPCMQAQAWHHGGWAIGVNLGPPVCYRPWCYDYGPGYYYGPGYPVYVSAPPPIVVQQAPVVVQPAPAAPVQRTASATSTAYSRQGEVDQELQLLTDASEKTRMDAVMSLGRMKSAGAVDPVTATLAGDKSPQVREAAARALGLIGSPRALTALKYAAQADNDRDVRHSAQFAIEIIQSDMKR